MGNLSILCKHLLKLSELCSFLCNNVVKTVNTCTSIAYAFFKVITTALSCFPMLCNRNLVLTAEVAWYSYQKCH